MVTENQEEKVETTTETVQEIDIESMGNAADPDPDAAAEVTYEPNFKYKAYDEELEMDEWARTHITSKESEDQFRGLFAKAGGFDRLKEDHGSLKTQNDQVTVDYNEMYDRLETLEHLKVHAPALFFKEVGISHEQIISYVTNLIAQKEMSPQQLAGLETQDQAVLGQFQQGREVEALRNQNHALSRSGMESDINAVINASPELSQLRQLVDSKVEPNKFVSDVKRLGLEFHAINKRDTTALQAVNEIASQWRKVFPTTDGTAAPATTPVAPGGVIPNVGKGDSSASPTKETFVTMEKLLEHAEKFQPAS